MSMADRVSVKPRAPATPMVEQQKVGTPPNQARGQHDQLEAALGGGA
jgi:hypothetical protein